MACGGSGIFAISGFCRGVKPRALSTADRSSPTPLQSFWTTRFASSTAPIRRVRGFSGDDAVVMIGDSLRHPVKWKDKTLSDLPPSAYHLRIHLTRATLFAVSISP